LQTLKTQDRGRYGDYFRLFMDPALVTENKTFARC